MADTESPSPLPAEPLSSTDSMEVWFAFVGPICLEMVLRNSALSSPEVPPAATASAFLPNDTHISTWISRLASWDCSRPHPAWGSQAWLPYSRPRGNSQVGSAVTSPLSSASGLVLTEPGHTYTHPHTLQMSREMRKGHTQTHTPLQMPRERRKGL